VRSSSHSVAGVTLFALTMLVASRQLVSRRAIQNVLGSFWKRTKLASARSWKLKAS